MSLFVCLFLVCLHLCYSALLVAGRLFQWVRQQEDGSNSCPNSYMQNWQRGNLSGTHLWQWDGHHLHLPDEMKAVIAMHYVWKWGGPGSSPMLKDNQYDLTYLPASLGWILPCSSVTKNTSTKLLLIAGERQHAKYLLRKEQAWNRSKNPTSEGIQELIMAKWSCWPCTDWCCEVKVTAGGLLVHCNSTCNSPRSTAPEVHWRLPPVCSPVAPWQQRGGLVN